ncbi:MAG: hypothetical protein ACK59A_11270 [Cyanobacteriota bacterium]
MRSGRNLQARYAVPKPHEGSIAHRRSRNPDPKDPRGGAGFSDTRSSGPIPPTRDRGTPPPSLEQQLVDKLRRIEALHARPGSEGERQAAERARERIQNRLKQLEADEPPIEVRFTLSDQWSRHLFVALLRRYGIRPYRYHGQRRTTVMARLNRSFMDDTLWPEFQDLRSTLAAYFDALTDRVIEQALEVKAGDADEQAVAAPQLVPQDHQGSLL